MSDNPNPKGDKGSQGPEPDDYPDYRDTPEYLAWEAEMERRVDLAVEQDQCRRHGWEY